MEVVSGDVPNKDGGKIPSILTWSPPTSLNEFLYPVLRYLGSKFGSVTKGKRLAGHFNPGGLSTY